MPYFQSEEGLLYFVQQVGGKVKADKMRSDTENYNNTQEAINA